MFDADRPIVSFAEDRLGRTIFAKYLARCILDNFNTPSLTIGLYGQFGVGKTSIINLMIEELTSAASNTWDDEKPILLNFSAWSYSGQEQLIYSFFRRLSSALRDAPHLPNAEKIIYLLELYVSFFTKKPIPKSLRQKPSLLNRILNTKKDNYAWESGRDLTHVKKELNELLRQQKHKIIIVIDNIMRLEHNEIKQIFQIVKSIGDFENTTYVLSLDKALMLTILNQIQIENPSHYLEKIIQLPFEIPPISPQDLETLLLARLEKLFAIVPEERWDKNYWADLYYSGIKYFFKNVRDVSRYVNILSFSFEHVWDVVNPCDFFAITAIEVFASEVYYGVRDNKDLFTDLVDDVYKFDEEKLAEDRLRCNEILHRAKGVSDERVLQLLIRLFPRLRSMYEPNVPFYHSETIARKNFRICSPDLFEVYFRLSMSTGTIPPAELNALLHLAKDEEGFALELMRLNHDDKIPKFLDLLDNSAVMRIPIQFIRNVINALLDTADLFPPGKSTTVSFNTMMRIHRIFHQLLRRFNNQEERLQIFSEGIKKSTNSIYVTVHELTLQSKQHVEESDTIIPLEHRDFLPMQLDELKKLAVAKIAYWAETKRLVDHPKLLPLLFAWKEWGEKKDCLDYVADITRDPKGLIAFLVATLQEPIDQTIATQEKHNWSSYLTNIENFIEPKILEPLAKSIFEDLEFEKLREKEQLAILIFLDLIKTKTTKIIPKTSV